MCLIMMTLSSSDDEATRAIGYRTYLYVRMEHLSSAVVLSACWCDSLRTPCPTVRAGRVSAPRVSPAMPSSLLFRLLHLVVRPLVAVVLLLPLLHAGAAKAAGRQTRRMPQHCKFSILELAANYSSSTSIQWHDPRETNPRCRNALVARDSPRWREQEDAEKEAAAIAAATEKEGIGVRGAKLLRPPRDLITYTAESRGRCLPPDFVQTYRHVLQRNRAFAMIATPKTGSTSAKTWLQDSLLGTSTSRRGGSAVAGSSSGPGFFAPHTFTTVRHPLTRFASCVATVLKKFKLVPKWERHFADAPGRAMECQDSVIEQMLEHISIDGSHRPMKFGEVYAQWRRRLQASDTPNPVLTRTGAVILYLLRNPKATLRCGKVADTFTDTHCWSQTTFLSMFPCATAETRVGSMPSTNVTEHRKLFTVDALIHFEDFDRELRELRQTPPWNQVLPQAEIPHEPPRELEERGSAAPGQDHWFPCDLAWNAYAYYKQDFECFGYRMPDVCLQPECLVP